MEVETIKRQTRTALRMAGYSVHMGAGLAYGL